MVRSVPSQKGFEIAIIGGGIAGVCLAIGLRKRGLKTTLYEQAPGFREIGAGVFLWQNAIDAMAVLDPELVRAYNSVATKTNPLPHIKAGSIYADAHSESSLQEILFTLPPSDTTGIHRAKFLEQVVQLLPDSIVRLDKRLEDIVEDQETGHLTMTFADGTSATADVIIGCDGIKSRVRQHVVGKGHPACNAVYTHKYVYRGLIPREEANKVIREDYENRHEPDPIVRCGKDGHIVTFPINSGTLLNLVAFHHDYNEWPDPRNTVRPATRLEMQKDFANFGRPVTELLKFSKPELDCWGLFDLKVPLPFYNQGRVCVLGDAAHASTPHLGAGASFAIEDASVLSELLADHRVQTRDHLKTVLAVYDASRRARTQWLVEASRTMGELYDLRDPNVGRDGARIGVLCNEAAEKAHTGSPRQMADEAIALLGQHLDAPRL